MATEVNRTAEPPLSSPTPGSGIRTASAARPARAELPRRLGFWETTLIVIGVTIGSGIFRVPASVADTVGSPAYNQKLSECRANAAKSNLAGKGVPEGAISASGKGETELMVQTGDGVKEPQNRRATIDLN